MLERLVKYTGPRLLKALEAKLKSIEADWLAQEALLRDRGRPPPPAREDGRTLHHPRPGRRRSLVYANQSNGWSGQAEVQIQEGVTVREGQTLFDLPDPKHMRVKVKVNESKMASVHPGQHAEIRVEAFPDRPLRGIVAEITRDPRPSQGRFSDIKIYFAIVNIESGGFEGLRPGMTGRGRVLRRLRVEGHPHPGPGRSAGPAAGRSPPSPPGSAARRSGTGGR